MASSIAMSPLGTVIQDRNGGDATPLWTVELRDLARGLCGGLFLALPLLFTLEMWERARIIPAWDIVVMVGLCYLANVGFAQFTGFKRPAVRRTPWFDALTAMGIGIVAATITLLLVRQLTPATPLVTSAKLVLLEMVPISFGASLAVNQLGDRNRPRSAGERRLSPDARELLGTTLGATMFAFNIAPTAEIQILGNGLTWVHLVGLIAFSLAVSAMMVFFTNFEGEEPEGGVTRNPLVETLLSYLVSLGVSAILLWLFGFIDFGTPIGLVVPWVITLGYATTLAGAAGRLIL